MHQAKAAGCWRLLPCILPRLWLTPHTAYCTLAHASHPLLCILRIDPCLLPSLNADAPGPAADEPDEMADIMAAVRLVKQRDAAAQELLPVRQQYPDT